MISLNTIRVLLFGSILALSPKLVQSQEMSDQQIKLFQGDFSRFTTSAAPIGIYGVAVKSVCESPGVKCFKVGGVDDALYAISTKRELWPDHRRSAREWGGYIGLNDATQPDKWEWDAGGSNDLDLWFAGEPNNRCHCKERKEEYAALHVATGRWNDYASHNQYMHRFAAIYEFKLR